MQKVKLDTTMTRKYKLTFPLFSGSYKRLGGAGHVATEQVIVIKPGGPFAPGADTFIKDLTLDECRRSCNKNKECNVNLLSCECFL